MAIQAQYKYIPDELIRKIEALGAAVARDEMTAKEAAEQAGALVKEYASRISNGSTMILDNWGIDLRGIR